MTDATLSTATPLVVQPVVVDIEATIKAEVAKAVAAVKAEESKIVTFVKAHYPKVIAAVLGYGAAAFGVIDKLVKLI